jgi:hypothetical protein
MKFLRKIKWWLQDNVTYIVIIYLIYASFVVYAGYAVGGLIKEWAKTHIIVIREI